MLGRRDSAVAVQLDSCLSGDAEPEGPEISGMVMAAAALRQNRRAVSETARSRAFDAMMREVRRQGDRPQNATPRAEDLTDPGIYHRQANAGQGLRLAVADIESIDDARLEEVAKSIAARLGQNAPDRNQ